MKVFGGLATAILIFIIGMACSTNFNAFMMEVVK